MSDKNTQPLEGYHLFSAMVFFQALSPLSYLSFFSCWLFPAASGSFLTQEDWDPQITNNFICFPGGGHYRSKAGPHRPIQPF